MTEFNKGKLNDASIKRMGDLAKGLILVYK